MVIVAFPAGTTESSKKAFGEMIRELTKDMTPEQFSDFERGWNESEMQNPLFIKRKPYNAISSKAKKRTQRGSKMKKQANKRKTSKRSNYVDLSKQQSKRIPQSPVVRIMPNGRVRPVAKYSRRSSYANMDYYHMSPQAFRDELFAEYVKVLTSKIGTGYYIGGDPDESYVPVIATQMFYSFHDGIRKGTRNDYLNNNKALKEACKRFGITTSPQFRNAWVNGIVIE
jgi:hypothetical protein